MIDALSIPLDLRIHRQWVLWRTEERDGKTTKVPYQPNGKRAESDGVSTWSEFEAVERCLAKGGYDGPGFVFSEHDPFCGVDLDGCRNLQSGKLTDWAREIVLAFDSYAEVSPTKTGVKLFVVGKNPFPTGRNKKLDVPVVNEKTPGIEIYSTRRFFAVTGWRLTGPTHPQHRQEQLDWLASKYWPDETPSPVKIDFHSDNAVVERARKYLAKMPGAISGQGGHNLTFHAACVAILGFGLSEPQAMDVLREWNQTCQPPWSERELLHKVQDANKQGGVRNYLRNTKPENWSRVSVPTYRAPPVKHEPKVTVLADAAMAYIRELRDGKGELIELGLADVDYAIGGGVERGEIVVIGARPSHGKSAVALQCIHTWTRNNRPCFIASEEMSSRLLGKRTVQYISDVPQEHWRHQFKSVEQELEWYATNHARCFIAESCGTAESVVEQIERAVHDHGIEVAVVDYVQLLRSSGKSPYERVTNASIALKEVAKKHNIVMLMLAQLSRQIESRPKFQPIMSDLKESGQLEQDADVILFLVWPYRIDSNQPAHEYQVWVAKNRNREINKRMVECRFLPSRQMLAHPAVKDRANYEQAFEAYNAKGSEPATEANF